jgi:hypothetical protein
VALSVAVLLHVPLNAGGLNDTGQVRCYDGSGAAISCTVATAADDGRYGRDAAASAGALTKAGAGANGFDFTKIANNGSSLPASAALGTRATDWACTRDNLTGLTWEVKTTAVNDLRFSGHSYYWYDTNSMENGGNAGSLGAVNTCEGTLPSNRCNTQAFVAAVNAVALCGYTDWRLPAPPELRTIINYGDAGAAISVDPTYLPNTRLNRAHWSAATYAADPAYAWVVEIGADDGGGAGHPHAKAAGTDTHSTGNELTLLVRGQEATAFSTPCAAGNPRANLLRSTPTPDFADNGDGTVTHTPTGLVWKRCPEGLSGEACGSGAALSMTWTTALATAESSAFSGFTDWRLPNFKELRSIVETCGYEPAINQTIFPATPRPAFGSVFWTSSTYAPRPADAWIVVFGHGGGVATPKESRLFVRLVRGGQSFSSFDAQNPQTPTRRGRAVRR